MSNVRRHFRSVLLLIGVIVIASLAPTVLTAQEGKATVVESGLNVKIRALEQQIASEKARQLETETGSYKENLSWGTGWGLRGGANGLLPAGGFSAYGSQISVGFKFPDFVPGFYLVADFVRDQGELFASETNWGVEAKVSLFVSTRLLFNFLKLYLSASGGILYKGPAYFPDENYDYEINEPVVQRYVSEGPEIFAAASLSAGGEIYLSSWAAVSTEFKFQFSKGYDVNKRFYPFPINIHVGLNLYLPTTFDMRGKL